MGVRYKTLLNVMVSGYVTAFKIVICHERKARPGNTEADILERLEAGRSSLRTVGHVTHMYKYYGSY